MSEGSDIVFHLEKRPARGEGGAVQDRDITGGGVMMG